MSYRNYPPEKNLLEVLKIAPQCAYIYISIWQLTHDCYNSLSFDKGKIREVFNTSPTRFRNNLTILSHLSLVKFQIRDHKFYICVKK